MSKTIAITGANGFIGSEMVRAFSVKGYNVKALVHHEPKVKIAGVEYCHYSIEDIPSSEMFANVDVLIHLAFAFRKKMIDGEDANTRAARFIKQLNLPKYVLMSSFAASTPVTPSYYGQCKRDMEELFKEDLILRPGLVLGNGGLFGRMKHQLQRSRFVPLLKSGKQVIQSIFVYDLVKSTTWLIEHDATGVHELAHPEKIFYKELLELMAKQLNMPLTFIPVPLLLMKGLVAALQLLPDPPFNKDNLIGLMASKYVDTSAEYKLMDGTWLSPIETLKKLR